MKYTLLSNLLTNEKRRLVPFACCKLFAAIMAAAAAYVTATIINGVFLEGMDIEKAAPYLAVLLFLLSLRHILTGYTDILADDFSASLRKNVRQHLHRTLLSSSPLDAKCTTNGHLLALYTETTDGLDDLARQLIPLVIESAVSLPLFFLIALCIDPWTASLFFLTFPIIPFLLYLIGRMTGRASAREWSQLSKLTAGFSELLSAIPSLKVWNATEGQIDRLAKLSDDFSSSSLSVLRLAFISAFALELITTLSIAMIAVSIGLRLLNEMLTFLPAFYALLIAPLFYQPLRESGIAFHAGVHAIAAAKELESFLETSDMKERRKYKASTPMPPSFTFDHVSFSYPNRTAKALSNISIYIPANRLTVLKGTSGVGKSTVLRLLAGFAAPTEGTVQLNDLPLFSIDPDFYASRIAYVPQNPYIFRATLRENISLHFGQNGTASLEEDDERLISALQAASLSHLTKAQNLNIPLGQGSQSLSFGERRRLGLARAIYQNAPIWLLDEITAGLDAENEAMILDTIARCKAGRTIVMTAHRPAVLDIADTIIEMEAEVHHA